MKKLTKALAVMVIGCAALAALSADVRADAPAGHFTDLGDGTVRDNATGLVWQKAFSPSSQAQWLSVTYCTDLGTSGGGWRLPTVLELRTIVDETRSAPAIDTLYFPATPSEDFWTATLYGGAPSDAYIVKFAFGYVGSGNQAVGKRARCVR